MVAQKEPTKLRGGGKLGLKGGGKGGLFKGSCFVCGKTGHRAIECTERVANSVDEVVRTMLLCVPSVAYG